MAFQPAVKVPRPTVPDFFDARGPRRISMSPENGMSRRAALMKLGVFLNSVVGVFLAVPIVRYLLSPVTRQKKFAYESWLTLGGLEQFPAGQTRLATYRNPLVN